MNKSRGLLLALVTSTFCALSCAEEGVRYQLNIESQPLGSALMAFGEQSGIQVLMKIESEVVEKEKSPRLVGEFTAQRALEQLLADSGLRYEFVNERTVRVGPVADRAEATQENAWTMAQAGAVVDPGQGSESREPGSEASLEEIVVSAQKREERLRDVPIPVTAISGEALVSSNQLRLQDYFTSIPSLSVQPGQNAAPVLAIRGITTGEANPTVGIVVDDVAYGSSTFVGGGSGAPDFDPSDLQRVEVLRGPQGTLYGASSIGGLFKFVTVDPSTDAFSGRLQGGVSSVRNGDEPGYNLRGAVNVPLSDRFAVRASAFTRQDPGYIDDPVLGLEGVNGLTSEGARVATLYRFSDDFSVKLAATLQHSERDGAPTVDLIPGLGDLQQNDPLGMGGLDRRLQTYSVTANATLGHVELTSLTGFNINKSTDSLNFSALLGGENGVADQVFGVEGSALLSEIDNEKVTQELRLAIPIGQRLELLLGGFFTHESSLYAQSLTAQDFFTGEVAGSLGEFLFDSELSEFAGFANLTYRVSDRFDIQFGGRQSRIEQNIVQTVNAVSNPRIDSTEDSFTYLVTPRFRVSADLMLYARLASGYRPGGPNYNSSTLGLPPTYEPDKTQNYEIGAKGAILDDALSFDASVYYIEWDAIQLALVDTDAAVGFTANGSKAKSRGVELAMSAHPLESLTVTAWGSWNEAELTEPFRRPVPL